MGTVVRRLSTLAYRKASDAVSGVALTLSLRRCPPALSLLCAGWVSSATDDDEHSGRESRWRDAESPMPFDRKQQNAREPLGHITPQRQRTASRGDVPSKLVSCVHSPHARLRICFVCMHAGSLKAGSPLTRPPLHSPAPPPDLPQVRIPAYFAGLSRVHIVRSAFTNMFAHLTHTADACGCARV